MRILAVTPYYVPEGGGLERYAHATLRRLAGKHDVHVVAASTRGEGAVEREGVRVGLHRPHFRLGNAPVRLDLSRRLRRIIRSQGIDVVVGHAPVPFPAEAAAHAAAKTGTPFVLTYHAGRLRGSSPPLDALAAVARATTQRILFQRSDHVICVSDFVRDNALRGHPRTSVIPPGVDAGAFHPGRADARQILFVGPLARNYRWKGVDVLWDAFEALRSGGVDCRLRLVGSGDRLQEFQARAAGRDDVRVDPRLSQDRLRRAFREAGIVALPSTTDAEAFGMVLAEANASGRPVVGSRVGGIPDFVRDGHNGLLAAPGDAGDLAARLRRLLLDPEAMDRMGARGRRLVRAAHDWDSIAQRTEDVLDAVVRPRPAPAVA